MVKSLCDDVNLVYLEAELPNIEYVYMSDM